MFVAAGPAVELSAYQWRNRLLLVFSPQVDDARLKQQTALVEAQKPGFDERDFKILTVPESSSLRKQFHVSADAFTVILIGKDGTEKHRFNHVAQSQTIFDLVDAMPMRKAGGR